MLVIPVHPIDGESLAGLVARASAVNHYRTANNVLSQAGVTISKAGSISSKSPELAGALADTLGTKDVDAVSRMFHTPANGQAGWVNFFGIPIRSIYLETVRRRVSPCALRISPHARAMWSVRVFSFDPETKETLIDACPGCGRLLGWSRTLGICFCDKCVRTEPVAGYGFEYPSVDLRELPQPIVNMDDVEALDFVTGLIDPASSRRSFSAKLIPECWSKIPIPHIFELVISIASALATAEWKHGRLITRGLDNRFTNLTPEILSRAGRAVIGGIEGFLALADMEFAKRSEDQYRNRMELGPLTAVWWDDKLAPEVRTIMKGVTDEAVRRATDTARLPIAVLAKMFGLRRFALQRLADSGLVPVVRTKDVIKGPVRMAVADIAALIPILKDAVEERRAGSMLGLHVMFLEELVMRGLIDKITGPVLGLLKSKVYYSRSSIERLNVRIWDAARRGGRAPADAVKLPSALGAINLKPVPWADVVAAIVDRKVEVFADPQQKQTLRKGILVADIQNLQRIFLPANAKSGHQSGTLWIGNATAAEILGTHEVAVWRLANLGKLTRHNGSYNPFKRSEVEAYAKEIMFVPEIQRLIGAKSNRAAVAWLTDRNVEPKFELQKRKWLVYDRTKVVTAITSPKLTSSATARLAMLRQQATEKRWIGRKEAAKIVGVKERILQRLVHLGMIVQYDREYCPFSKDEVESLARTTIFVPEIGKRIGIRTRRGVLRWLGERGIQPSYEVMRGKTPAYVRSEVEAAIPQLRLSKITGKAYPGKRRKQLIALVQNGLSANKAAVKVGVAESTAKRWVQRWRSEGVVPTKRKPKVQIESCVGILRDLVGKDPQSTIRKISLNLKRQTGVLASEPGIRKCIARNSIPWKEGALA